MQRRDFLIGGAAMALGARVLDARLGSTWTMPEGTSVELWPADLGLDLAGALEAVARWRIVPGARVAIRLADDVHVQRGMLDLRHPDGIRLSIVGNTANPERCRLAWQGSGDGLYCGAGAVLGRIDGVQIEHTAIGARGQGSALLAERGGAILCGPRMIVRGFYHSCHARHGGIIRCGGMVSHDAGAAAYLASHGGQLHCEGALADNSLVAGFAARAGGIVRAHRASTRNNGGTGFHASGGGSIIIIG